MTRVLIADDQTLIREGLSTLLGLLPGIEVVGAAADGDQALSMVGSQRPDIVLMDLRMPRCDGVEATRRIRAGYPETQVIVLTTYADDESILAAIQAGARGYLTKDAGAEEIQEAIQAVEAGNALLEPAVQARLLEALARGAPTRRGGEAQLPDGLTRREAEVLILIAQGLSNQTIAQRLFVSEATVKTHINNLFGKIGARDRAQAVAYAYRRGLAEP
jgi:DNA-binding NarL/FixJ family response regulator